MITTKIRLILLLVLPTIVLTQDYCKLDLCRKGTHIACKNSGAFASTCGSNPRIIQMTQTLRTQILVKHNTLRNQIAGGFKNFLPAARMASMKWSDELAKLAEFNVKQCQMKHDKCRNTRTFKFAGQNLATTTLFNMERSVLKIVNTHIQNFFDEYKDCDMSIIRKYTINGKKIGHFTSMMQERATHVGCAILRHTKSNGGKEQLMACNYAYTNVLNQPVYTTGKAASRCLTGPNINYKNLCSIYEVYNLISIK